MHIKSHFERKENSLFQISNILKSLPPVEMTQYGYYILKSKDKSNTKSKVAQVIKVI